MKKILVVNGPNINMLGVREPHIYGKKSYDDLLKYIHQEAKCFRLTVEVFQSNSEGEIITKIQKAKDSFDAIIINAGGYTHSSIAILDALIAVELPVVEVHLSDITNREDFRKHSFISHVASKIIMGKGFLGYKEAIEYLAKN